MKMVRLLSCVLILLVSIMAIGMSGVTLAQEGQVTDNTTPAAPPVPELITSQEEEPSPTEVVVITATYPTVEAIAGGTFVFEVELSFFGAEPKIFDLRITAPTNWEVYMTPRYEKDRKISSITLKPSFGAGETIMLNATAPFYPLPEPGDYKIKLEAVSDTVKKSAELTAKVTARYAMQMVPTSQLYNTAARSGKDNYFSIEVGNLGTASIENIKFSTTNPEGWSVEYSPEKIDLLEAFDSQTVQMNIKPPPDTIAGDYYISLRASGTQTTSDEVRIRVTVQTPTIWGWVGVIIIVIVVIGLIVIFMRFSRR